MTISVVIPTKNEEAYIEGCLAAIFAQTRKPDEVIVVDNGSTDRTSEIAIRMGAKVINCPTPGVAVARQAGLEAATGDWVATTDADSRPVPAWLELLQGRMDQAVAVYGPMRMFGLPRWQESLTELGYGVFLKLMTLLRRPNMGGANMAFRRDLALEVGGYPNVLTSEDVRLGLALMKHGAVRYVPGALVLTSARRVNKGWIRFFYAQLRNLFGKGEGYFEHMNRS